MNGNANCIFEVCCPPGVDGVAQESAVRALADEFMKEFKDKLSWEDAIKYSRAMYKHFDLAPRGSLREFKKQIVEAFKAQ